MALTILTFLPIAFLSWAKLIVAIKLMTFWLDLNFRLGIIFFPTLGVTARKTQLQALTISWLFFAIETFLNCLLSLFAAFLFLGDKITFLKDILDTSNEILRTWSDFFLVYLSWSYNYIYKNCVSVRSFNCIFHQIIFSWVIQVKLIGIPLHN